MHACIRRHVHVHVHPLWFVYPKGYEQHGKQRIFTCCFFPDITHLMMEFYYWHDHFLVMIIFAEYLEDHPMWNLNLSKLSLSLGLCVCFLYLTMVKIHSSTSLQLVFMGWSDGSAASRCASRWTSGDRSSETSSSVVYAWFWMRKMPVSITMNVFCIAPIAATFGNLDGSSVKNSGCATNWLGVSVY